MGYLMAAVLTLVMMEGYLRPAEMLCLTPASFVLQGAPTPVRARSTRGGTAPVSGARIPLDSKRFPWMHTIYQLLSHRPGSEYLLGWTYPEYVAVFRRACANLGWSVVPYQGRHTGASADLAEGLRTQKQVMRRGRWQNLRRVRHYQRAGRVNQAWKELNDDDRNHAQLLPKLIEGIFLRGDVVPAPPNLASSAGPGLKRARSS